MSEGNYWAILTAPLLESDAVSDGAKLFYAQISRYTNKLGYCWASNEILAADLSLGERTISRYVAELAAAGFISVERVGVSDRKRRTERRIRVAVPLPFDVAKNGEASVAKNGEVNVAKNGEANVAKNGEVNVAKNGEPIESINNILTIHKNNNPPIPPAGGSTGKKPPKPATWMPERFDSFWAYYRLTFCAADHNRAGGRAEALAAWDKLKPDEALLRRIGAHLKAVMRTRQWADGYGIKYASTYLNAVRLGKISLDELPEATPPRGSGDAKTTEEVLGVWT